MPTYPDVPFVDGQVWSPDLAYLAFHQSFGDSLDQDILGNHPGITDAQLSTTGVLSRVNVITDSLKPTNPLGLTVAVASGVIRSNHQSVITIPQTNVLVPDNNTSYVFIRSGGLVPEVDTRMPTVAVPIARAVAAGGVITALTDLRQSSYRHIDVSPDTTLVFGGQSTIDKVCTAGEVFDQGIYYFRDFTVPSGVSITVDKYAVIKCSGRAIIDGTIDVPATIPGGIEWSGNNYNLGTNTYVFPRKGFGLGAYGVYAYGLQPYGSGGDTGQIFIAAGSTAPTAWATGRGGRGGGGISIQASQGIEVGGSINCRGGNATNSSIVGASSWVISGCSGGSGGYVNLTSPTSILLKPGSIIDVKGGNGGNASISAGFVSNAGSGGGAAGGVVVLQAPSGSINTTGSTITLTGGTSGNFVVNDPGNLSSFLTGSVGAAYMTTGSTSHISGSAPVGQNGLLYLLNYLPLG